MKNAIMCHLRAYYYFLFKTLEILCVFLPSFLLSDLFHSAITERAAHTSPAVMVDYLITVSLL